MDLRHRTSQFEQDLEREGELDCKDGILVDRRFKLSKHVILKFSLL